MPINPLINPVSFNMQHKTIEEMHFSYSDICFKVTKVLVYF